jgi:hypothetical protein
MSIKSTYIIRISLKCLVKIVKIKVKNDTNFRAAENQEPLE